jgi:hypothetical protein
VEDIPLPNVYSSLTVLLYVLQLTWLQCGNVTVTPTTPNNSICSSQDSITLTFNVTNSKNGTVNVAVQVISGVSCSLSSSTGWCNSG